ncbi:biopolymer transport protein ExbB [Fibrobacter sp. UWCM]|jgi:biopolymer transport protein ExbB|uniref:MotA/TolQ/ExbB proton channel family protein n=1 Tax=Fibrobacter sp. UWCM TaxID=1896208 RepID=UPI00091E1BDC|nr:MotA/TolQ/ExbB proton channel family protein [Fibrobacter sp. UWCM]SHG57628.1 biopolymer transport protein ExbB [Fibrobacter sp. UWCM]
MMKFGIRNSELGIGLNRHPERSAKRGVEGSSARFFIPLVVAAFAILAPAANAQQPSDIDAVKKRAELNSAKADLEEARKKRDMAVAARWKDRETANQEREMFNDKYQESKEKVDALMSERARLFEDVRVAREDLAQVKLQAEKARAEFLSLAAGPERLETLAKFQEQGVPFKMAERVEVQNKVKKEMGLYKDDPLRIAKGVLDAARAEMAFTRETSVEKAELVFGSAVAQGDRMRLGGLYAVQMANVADIHGLHAAAMMLPVAGEKKRAYSWQENLAPEAKKNIATVFANVNDSAFVMVPVDVLLSTELSSELANHQETTWKDKLRQFFKDGGIIMYPIVALFAIGLLIALWRFVWLMVRGFGGIANRRVLKALKAGDIDTARSLAAKTHGEVGKVLRTVLSKNYAGREGAEKALEELFSADVPKLESGLTWISVIAATAPLLGLLGTVMGMIELFDVITMHGTSDPKLLAGGISIALVTTEAGLIAAIPLQLIHTFLVNRADAVRSRMESAGLAVLNALWIKEK